MLIVYCVNTQFLSADCAFDLQLCFSSRDFTCRLIMKAFEETKPIAHSVLGRKLICSPLLCGLLWEKRSSRESIAILALPCSNTITWAVKGNHRPMNWINRNFVCFRSKKKKWETNIAKALYVRILSIHNVSVEWTLFLLLAADQPDDDDETFPFFAPILFCQEENPTRSLASCLDNGFSSLLLQRQATVAFGLFRGRSIFEISTMEFIC